MRVGIIGQALTIEKENYDWSVEDTVFFTVKKALKSSSLEIGEIETVISAGDDVLDGLAINHCQTVEAAGAFLKEESKVERDGAWAVHYAMARLLSGKFQTAMVVAFSKGTQCGLSPFSGMVSDPFYLRPVGTDSDTICAIQAEYFSQRLGASEKDFALVAQKNRSSGSRNERVMKGEGKDYSIEEILDSPQIATPIRELTTGRVGDGCTVLILATEEYVKKNKRKASFITGVSFISDAYYPTYRDLSKVKSASVAAGLAYKMAGVDPKKIDLAEVHECYAHQEVMLYESLGLCSEGESISFLRDGNTKPNGKIPVNPSGGVLCGNVIYASGLTRLLESHLQVIGEAGSVQVKNAKSAIAHAQAGLAMQANIVYVIEA
ncbi:MAG: thiolase family protein [Leptospiraceae bacterium]|nr:thiolase family protein [Leptospiraceae bacterium]NUM42613.1 thiolase family protein [Leptospiraceae bacterium]